MKLNDLSLATRVIAGVFAIVVAGTATLLFAENVRLRENFVSERQFHLENDLDENGARMSQMVNSLRQDVLFLSHIPPVSGIMRALPNHDYDALEGDTRKRWEKRLLGIFNAFSDAHPEYYKIRYIAVANGGYVIGQTDKHQSRIDAGVKNQIEILKDADFFKAGLKLKQDQVWLSKFELKTNDEAMPVQTLRAVTAVFTPSGKIFGLVVVSMDASSLLKTAESDLPGILTYLSNRDGQYLIHPDKNRAFTFAPGNTNFITADFPLLEPIFKTQSTIFLPLQTNTQSRNDSASLLTAKRIHFDSADPSRFLVLLYYLPDSEVAKQVSNIPTTALLDEFLVVLLISIIIVIVLRRTFLPLKQITIAAGKIADGHNDFKLPQISGGEIGSLTAAINAMMVKLSQREIELKKSESELKATLTAIPDLFCELGIDGRFHAFHSPRSELLDLQLETLRGTLIMDAFPREAADTTLAALQEASECGFSFGKEINLTHWAGNPWLELSIARKSRLPDEDERFIVIARNISERKMNEKKQRTLTEKIHQFNDEILDLYENAPCGYHSLDKDGYIQRINKTELRWLGYTRDEILGKLQMLDLLSPASVIVFQQRFRHFKIVGEIHDLEMEMVCKNGSILPVLLNATAVYDPNGKFVTSRTTLYNMSERKKMDQEKYIYVKRLEEMSRHLVAAQEDGRRRLSSELHDRTSPNLAAISLNMNIIASTLSHEQSAEIFERLEDTNALIADTTTSIREICADMRPPLLDYAGLAAALESYLQQFSRRTGIEVIFDCTDRERRHSQELESLLFRIAQEALTNCAKHSRANSVVILLSSGDYPISMIITDDGVGFDPEQLGKEGTIGLGLINMREMAEVAGGRFVLESAPGYGTRIAVENLF